MDEQIKSSRSRKFLMGFICGVVIMLIASGVVYGAQAMGGKSLSKAKVKTAVSDFVNKDLPAGQDPAVVDSIENFNCGLYKLQLSLGGQKAEAYVTKDGKIIFPAAIDMATNTEANANQPAQTPANITKSDKPKVELFVMSYCPYGTQIEKGIIPTVEALGNKIDFSLKFVNYAMHGKNEIDENARQYCIQKEQSDKLMPYMKCFLKDSNSASCLTSVGINKAKLDSCVSASDKQFKLTDNFNNKQTWLGSYPPFDIDKADNQKYGVEGSPTLVINGTVVDSGRDSAGLLKTICAAFNDQPEACSKSLSAATPAPGFGEGTATNATNADCVTQ